MLTSSAQNFEDIVLWRALRTVKGGTYVDVGAADPELDSVTKLFYDNGWSGINIEPVAELADRLSSSRVRDLTVQVCAGPANGNVILHRVEGTGLSTLIDELSTEAEADGFVVESIEVPMRRLDEILEQAGYEDRQIHFLKVDAEGYEGAVFEGIDLGVWRPWVIVAEATYPRTTTLSYETWEPLVVDHGYEFCLFDGLNRFYVAKEHTELRELLSYPACVFDQPFVTAAHGQLIATNEQNERAVARLEAENTQLIATCAALEADRTNLSAELVGERSEVAALRAQINAQLDALTRGATELDHARKDLADERSGRQLAERDLSVITASTSWRMTAPVRAAIDAGRRLARRRRQ